MGLSCDPGIRYHQNSNLISRQLNLNLTVVGFDVIMTLHHHPTTRDSTQVLVGCKLVPSLKTISDNSWLSQTTILDYPRQLSQTIPDNNPRLSQTFLDRTLRHSQTISLTILDNTTTANNSMGFDISVIQSCCNISILVNLASYYWRFSRSKASR